MIDLLIDRALSDNYWMIAFCFTAFYYLIFKSNIYNLFDPLLLTILTCATSSALVTRLLILGDIQERYFLSYLACNIFLLIGFKIHKKKIILENKHSAKACFCTLHLFRFLIVISIIHFSMLLYTLITVGLAIFADNPAEARVGISAALKWGNVVLEGSRTTGLLTAIFLTSYDEESNLRRIFCAILSIGFVMSFLSVGNKAAAFDITFVIGSYLIYTKSLSIRIPVVIHYITYAFIGLGFSYFTYAASVNNQSANGIDKFLTRIAMSGDSYVHFFVNDQYDMLKYTYNPITYLLHIVTSAFGIKLIDSNIGVKIYGLSTGDYDSGFGPNPQYVIEGIIFFGIYFAPFYACAIGYLFRYLREMCLGKSGNYNFILSTIFLPKAGSILIDINMSTYNFISCILITTTAYIIANILSGYKIFSRTHEGETC